MSEDEPRSSYQKGLTFEYRLAELFRNRGYTVRSVVKEGKSGVRHQIDVFAELQAPLHASTLVIEAKCHDAPIDKDAIIKLDHVVRDIGANKGIVATTSHFTPAAIKTARALNIELWDRERLVRELGKIELDGIDHGTYLKIPSITDIIEHQTNYSEAKDIVCDLLKKRERGIIFGIGGVIEDLELLHMFYYPFYEVDLKAIVYETRRVGLLSKETVEKILSFKISIDALSGELVDIVNDQIIYPFAYLKKLNTEETHVLKELIDFEFDLDDVISLGYRRKTAIQIVDGLLEKEALEVVEENEKTWFSFKVPFPSDPSKLNSLTQTNYVANEKNPISTDIPPKLDSEEIAKRVDSFWDFCEISDIKLVLYPVYVSVLRSEDNSKRVEVIDGVTGEVNSEIASNLTWEIDFLIALASPLKCDDCGARNPAKALYCTSCGKKLRSVYS